MSLLMLRKSWRDLRWTLFWYGVGLALYSLGILSAYPSVRDNGERFQDLLSSYPEALLKAFGIQNDITSLPGFIGAEFLNVIWPLIVAVFVVMAGSAIVAQEIERGTAELWLSVPESRSRLFLGKLVALWAGILVLTIVTIVAIALGALLVDAALSARQALSALPVLFAFPFAMAGYSVLLSSVMSERGKAAGLAGGLTLLFYLIWVFSGLVPRLDWLRYLSIFTAYDPQHPLRTSSVPWPPVLLLLVVGIVTAGVALIVFRRRNVIP